MTLSDIVLIVLFVTLGALLGGVISFGSGQYALSKSFALTQDSELLTSLRFDISVLKKVDTELGENLDLLMNKDVVPSVKFAEAGNPYQQLLFQFLENLYGGPLFRITKRTIPRQEFVVDSWPEAAPNVTEIDFTLYQDLTEFYRTLSRVNESIKEIRYWVGGGPGVVSMRTANRIDELNATIDQYVADLTQVRITQLRSEVTLEIQRLEARRRKIIDKV